MSHTVIGQSVARLDAWGKVTGETIYPGDRSHAGELWLKVLFTGRPHARIVSLDVSAALALPGVVDVLTAADVPVNEYGLMTPDQPVLCGPGSAKAGSDIVRCVSDRLAIVIAASEKIAAQARDLIRVEYEDLPLIDSTDLARSGLAPQLHPDKPGNIADYKFIRKGEVESAWAECAAIVEGVYRTPYQEHAYLQPEAGTAYYDDAGRLTVRCAGQWTWADQQALARLLNLPPEQVRVIYDAIGGAFGGREDMNVQLFLALAARHLKEKHGLLRPVKIIWSREESIIGHIKRHPMTIKARWGARADGTLVAAEIEIVADAGGYMSSSNEVLNNTVLSATGAYEISHVKVDGYAVYTNNIVTGAFRGFGGPQPIFAAEMQLNKLAEKLGLDPVEMRLRNVLTDDKLTSVGTPMPGGVTFAQLIRVATQAAGWSPRRGPRGRARPAARLVNGRGLAVGLKNVGFGFGYPEYSWARVELRGQADIEAALVCLAGADVGQGHHTVMAQIAAEVLQVNLAKVSLAVSDTAFTRDSGSASASRLTFMAGNAVKQAAELALQRWRDEDRPAVAEAEARAPATTTFAPEGGVVQPNFAYGYVAEWAEVTVDTETGFIKVNRVICADDVGKAVNPQQITGQIEGAVVQGHGYALLEDFRVAGGQVLTPHFSTYLIPGVYDIPEQVASIIVENPHPHGPFGVRGMAEMPLVPYTAAIAAAVFDATGVWFDEFPLTPERVLRGLGKLPTSPTADGC